MACQNHAPGITAAACGTDIVLLHLAEDGAAQHFHSHGNAGDCDGEGRQNHIPKAGSPALRIGNKITGNKYPKKGSENKGGKNADKKRRNAHDDLVKSGDDHIQHLAAGAAGQNSQRNGQHHGDQEGQNGQDKGDGQLIRQHSAHRHVITVAFAHVTPNKAGQPVPVAHQHGTIQSQFGTQSGHRLRRGLGAQHFGGGVTGNHLKRQKGEKRNNEQSNNQSDKFLYNIFQSSRLLRQIVLHYFQLSRDISMTYRG